MNTFAVPVHFCPAFIEIYNNIPEQLLAIEGISREHLDTVTVAQKYTEQATVKSVWSIDQDSNKTPSYPNYIYEITTSWRKIIGYHDLFCILQELYGIERAQQLLTALWMGDLYLHDSTMIMAPYCWAYATSYLLFNGAPWGQLPAKAPRNRREFVDLVKETTIELAQQQAGALAISDFIINYAYFVRTEQLDLENTNHIESIIEDFHSLLFGINKKYRLSHQSPFTNLSIFDRPNLEHLFSDAHYPDGSKPDNDLIWHLQCIFCNWFKNGTNQGLPFRFPVVTLNIRLDEKRNIIDKAAFEYFAELNVERACFNIYISSGNKIASCCRLVNDFDLAGIDSFGNGGISLGSHRIITINLARLGHRAKNSACLTPLVQEQLESARDLLVAHRVLLKRNIQNGLLPFFTLGLLHEERMFSTIGLNGLYECMKEINQDLTTPEGQMYAQEMLSYIKAFAQKATKETKNWFNVEQVPAETLAVSFAAKDRIVYQMPYTLYANQFIPLWVDCDIADRINIDGIFSQSLTGGSIVHINCAEALTASQMKRIISYAISCGCEHFAVNYNYCVCAQKHITIAGPSTLCPICAEPITEQYTRVVGMLTPLSSWNPVRQYEHAQRTFTKQVEIQP